MFRIPLRMSLIAEISLLVEVGCNRRTRHAGNQVASNNSSLFVPFDDWK